MPQVENLRPDQPQDVAEPADTANGWRPPATYLQEAWFHASPRKRSAHNIVVAWEILGLMDWDALANAVEALIRRHDILRTALHTDGNRVCQVIKPGDTVCLRRVDLSHLPTPRGEVTELIATEGRHEFSLSEGPLWQPWIIRLGARHHVMLNVFSHIISDGWSTAVAFRDLTRLYEQCATRRPARLPDMQLQFGDYATWERDLSHAVRESWWKDHLASADTLNLPLRPDWTDHNAYDTAGLVTAPVIPAAAARLAEIARDQGVSLASVVSAGVAAALSRYAGERIVIGFMYANRERSSVQPMFGPLFDYLPVPIDVSGNPCFVDLLHRWSQAFRDAMAHRLPLGLIEKCRGDSGSRRDLFDVAVDFLPISRPPARSVTLDRGQVTTFSSFPIPFSPMRDRGTRRFAVSVPLTYMVKHVADGGFRIQPRANFAALSEETASTLGADLTAILCQAGENPAQRIRDLSVVS